MKFGIGMILFEHCKVLKFLLQELQVLKVLFQTKMELNATLDEIMDDLELTLQPRDRFGEDKSEAQEGPLLEAEEKLAGGVLEDLLPSTSVSSVVERTAAK